MSRRFLYLLPSLFPLGPRRAMNPVAAEVGQSPIDLHITALDHSRGEGITAGESTWHPFPAPDQRLFTQVPSFRRMVKRLQPELVHAWGEPAGTVARLALGGLESVRLIVSQFRIQNPAAAGVPLAVRRLGKRPEKIVVPHSTLADHLIHRGERTHRIRVLSPGAAPPSHARPDARQALQDRFEIADSTWIIGAYSPFEPRQRLKDLIWAAHLLACCQFDARFLLFGKGPQEWRLRRFLAQTQGGPLVEFAGEPADADFLFEGLDNWWHAHRRSPRDLNVLSALRCEIPVIGVEGNGLEDVLVNQVTGLTASFGARDEFARWTKYLLEQPAARKQLARQGREHVEQNFPLEKMIEGYQNLYNWVDQPAG